MPTPIKKKNKGSAGSGKLRRADEKGNTLYAKDVLVPLLHVPKGESSFMKKRKWVTYNSLDNEERKMVKKGKKLTW